MTGIVDCDIHNTAPSVAHLQRWLDPKWHPYVPQVFGRTWAGVTVGARQSPDIYRRDARPPEGGPPGSDLSFLQEQHLDRWGIEKAILNPLEVLAWQLTQHGEFAHALSHASNRWLVDEWLDRDPRLYGSISIPQEDGPRAAEEIARMAPDERFVAVIMTVWGREPFGHPKYRPIFEAAVEHGLPVVLHVGGWSGTLVAGGTPTYWVEHHSLNHQAYATHVTSLVYSGIFDQLPGLQIVLEEGGVGWMPSLLWRLDRAWRSMGAQMPHLQRTPSEVVREHFHFTTQPFDEPRTAQQLLEVLGHLDMDDRLMFSSDYPHHDFDAPTRVLPPRAPAELRAKVLGANAERLFGFGAVA